jgi:hypothetical protein
LARQANGSDAWRYARKADFRDVAKAFLGRERAEDRLFQEAYDRDIGAEG